MILPSPSLSRRTFLTSVAGLGAGLLLRPLVGRAGETAATDDAVARLVAATLGIDTHNHIDVPLTGGTEPDPVIDLAGEMRRSGLAALCMTFAVDYQPLVNPGDGYSRFLNGLSAMDRLLQHNGLKRALTLADLQAERAAGRPTVIQSVEGGHFLEGKRERLAEAHARGLRHLGLLHDNDALVPLGDIYTKPARFGGLADFGRDVITDCNRLGILIDLAHGNAEMVDAALRTSTKPIIVSHTGPDWRTGTNANLARMMQPRLISRERAKIVADAGGVIGVWTHLADSPADYAYNIQALVDVVGIDHVCLGTDTKLTPPTDQRGGGPARGRPPGDGPKEGPKEGPSGGDKAKGEPRRPRVGERTNEAWAGQTEGFYFAVTRALLDAGFTADEIGKIGGGNFTRVFAATAG